MPHRIHCRLSTTIASLCLAYWSLSGWAVGQSPQAKAIAAALAKPINPADQTLNDTKAFVEARIFKGPSVKTLDEWTALEHQMRSRALSEVVFRGQALEWVDASTKVEWLEVIEGGPGYRIRKLRFEIIPGFWVPALLYEPTNLNGRRVPVFLNVNGHDAKGKAADYKQLRCINLAKRGILAMNLEWLGMGQLATDDNRHWMINHIDLQGTSGVALHFLSMWKAVDVLLAHEAADPRRLGLTGLSGGGWQTIFYSALDPRVTLSVPVAGYSSFFTRARFPSDLGDSEQTPVDLGKVTDYSLMTAMLGSRSALLTFNAKDNCCFAADHALPPLVEAARPIFKLHGREEKLRTHVNQDPGTHNYLVDNREALYRMIGDVFYPADAGFNAKEIASEAELKSAEALSVALPKDNLSIAQVAINLGRDLPRPEVGRLSKVERRGKLTQILKRDRLSVSADKEGETMSDGLKTTRWRLRVGPEWTIPAVEFSKATPSKGTALILLDAGKSHGSVLVEEMLAKDYRVCVVDPYNFGESTFATHGYLWSLFVSTVGERPLGVQVSQVVAVAFWLMEPNQRQRVILVADGPRSTTVGLCAAVVEPQAIGALDLRNALTTLKSLTADRVSFEKAPELFCFGLLESFDIPQLKELIEPRPISSK